MKKLLILFVLLSNICSAQERLVDSLRNLIQNEKNDSIKIDIYNKLAWYFVFNDKEKARATLKEVEEIASKDGQEYGYNSWLNIWGVFYDINGLSDSAKMMFERSLVFSQDNNFKVHEEHTLNNLGMFSWNTGDFKAALDYYFKSLKLVEERSNADKGKDGLYNNIGLIYQDMELHNKAIPYHKKALKIRTDKGNQRGQATSYNNLGICYSSLEKFEEAEGFLKKGMAIAKNGRDKNLYYEIVDALASLYAKQDKNDRALVLYEASYNRPKSLPFNPNKKVNTLSGLAALHFNKKHFKKAIDYGEECLDIVQTDTSIDFLEVDIYNTLAQAYFALGNIEKGNDYNEKFYERTAEKFKESTAQALQELETKYETQKKELALQKSRAREKQKNLIILSSLGLAFLLGLIGYLVYKQQKVKNIQLIKENELEQALVQIEHQNNMQEQRLGISKELHDNIGSQLTFIISSLDSLKQFDIEDEPLFNKIDTIGGFTKDAITDLRDTVWAMNKEEITFEDLKERTTQFIERANKSTNRIDFQFSYPMEFGESTLSSKVGIDVYRIIQEAVNNAVKHAKASEVVVNFKRKNSLTDISISDNGTGFDPSMISSGNGLQSMKSRADKIGAQFNIESEGQGTTVLLTFSDS